MPLMPKRVKFRKSARGVIRGNAQRGNTVSYGDFGLQSLEGGWLSAEAKTAQGHIGVKVWINNGDYLSQENVADQPAPAGGRGRGRGPRR